MKTKIKDYSKFFALFVLLYIAMIVGGTAIYTHIKFGNIIFDDVLVGFHDALELDWAICKLFYSLVFKSKNCCYFVCSFAFITSI